MYVDMCGLFSYILKEGHSHTVLSRLDTLSSSRLGERRRRRQRRTLEKKERDLSEPH